MRIILLALLLFSRISSLESSTSPDPFSTDFLSWKALPDLPDRPSPWATLTSVRAETSLEHDARSLIGLLDTLKDLERRMVHGSVQASIQRGHGSLLVEGLSQHARHVGEYSDDPGSVGVVAARPFPHGLEPSAHGGGSEAGDRERNDHEGHK